MFLALIKHLSCQMTSATHGSVIDGFSVDHPDKPTARLRICPNLA